MKMKEKLIKKIKSSKYIFAISCFIYLFNSIGNVSQGVLIKYFTLKYKSEFLISTFDFLLLKCLISFLVLSPFFIKSLFNLLKNKKSFLLGLAVSILYSMDIIFWNKGLESIPVNNGIIIMLLIPIWISVFSRLILEERDFSRVHLISFSLCFLGVVISVLNSNISISKFNVGYILIFFNTLIISLGLVFQKKFKGTRTIGSTLLLNSIISFLIIFLINNILTGNKFVTNFNSKIILSCFLVSIFDILEFGSVYLAYSLYTVSSLQPIRFTRIAISGILSYLFLNEKISFTQFISISIILLANSLIPLSKIFKKSVK